MHEREVSLFCFNPFLNLLLLVGLHDLRIYKILTTALHARKCSTLEDTDSLCELIVKNKNVHACQHSSYEPVHVCFGPETNSTRPLVWG